MDATLYKRLFEVRFLHEYHLSDREQGGSLFFTLPPLTRQQNLPELIRERRIDIRQHLTFDPTPETQEILKGHRVKFWENATGFTLATGVDLESNPIGIRRAKPSIPFDANARLSFYVRAKDPRFFSFSAVRIAKPPLGGYYFFTNEGKVLSSNANINLSKPIQNIRPNYLYEPGELALIGGVLHQALIQTHDLPIGNWTSINTVPPINDDGYVGEQDRVLIGKQIQWPWTAAPQVVEFVLRDNSFVGVEVKKIKKEIKKSNVTIALDFRRKDPESGEKTGAYIPDGYYTLEANGTTDKFSQQVYLHSAVAQGNPSVARPGVTTLPKGLLGIVQIKLTDDATGASFITTDGFIRQLSLADGTLSHLIYEVQWLNRSLWWRYRSDRGKELNAVGVATTHLSKEGRDLRTKNPQRFHTQQAIIATGVNIPSPGPDQLRVDPPGRFIAEVLVSKIPSLIEPV